MISSRGKVALAILAIGPLLASCSDGSPTQPTVNPVDDTSIEAQIRALFPSGASLQGAALTQIADIRQQIALSAMAQARSRTLTLVDFTMTSFRDAKLVGGTSVATGNAASRLVNTLYQLVGMAAPNLPDSALTNDGVAKVVGPEGAAVVTPSGVAGVQIPAGALDQQVLVTVTRLPTPPTPGTGPLPTSLKQYPPYYEYATYPAVAQFGSSARVGLCQVTDPASPFYPPEPHDRLRLAHTVAGNIEILDRVAVDDFLRCTGVSASRSASGTRSVGWRGALASLVNDVMRRLGPVELYAAHGGLGGKVKSFSPFGAVDPAVATAVFAQVTAGVEHTCGLTNTGVAYCWGGNPSGQIGDGTAPSPPLTPGWRLAPTPVSGGLSFVGITAGSSHTCAFRSDGTAYCWGSNGFGQLGDGTTQGRLVPTPVAGGLSFIELTAGYNYTCGLTSAGTAYCWGTNGFGEIGDGTKQQRLVPTPVGGGLTFIQLTAGTYHTCGLASTGAAYCWGNNLSGELGVGEVLGLFDQRLLPTPVVGGISFADLTAAIYHTCGRTSAGAAYCWGNNGRGQLGDGTTQSRLVPTPISGGFNFVGIKAGSSDTCASRSDGSAYCWGDNYAGQLGNGTQSGDIFFGPGIPIPTAVSGHLSFSELTVGSSDHTCGRTTAGTVYCWGYNGSGQLGDGTQQTRLVPTPVKSP